MLLPWPLFAPGGGPGGGNLGRITFLSTGLSVSISPPVGKTSLAPGRWTFRFIDSPLGDRLWPKVVITIGGGASSRPPCSTLCLSYLAC